MDGCLVESQRDGIIYGLQICIGTGFDMRLRVVCCSSLIPLYSLQLVPLGAILHP
jgi:hypothetical protein